VKESDIEREKLFDCVCVLKRESLCVCLCMYQCVHVCVCVCLRSSACWYACECVGLFVCRFVRLCVRACMRAYISRQMSQFSMALMKRFSEYVSLEGMYPIISTTFRARPCGTKKKCHALLWKHGEGGNILTGTGC